MGEGNPHIPQTSPVGGKTRGNYLRTALQVGTAKVVGDSGVLVDLLGLVAVIETEGET